MKRTTTWQLTLVILITLATLYVNLGFAPLDWLSDALFWRPPGQREIELQLGYDVGVGKEIILMPQQKSLSAEVLNRIERIEKRRLRALGYTLSAVEADQGQVTITVPDVTIRPVLTQSLSSIGLVELVNAGFTPPSMGQTVETSLDRLGQPREPISPTGSVTGTTQLQTVLSGKDLRATRVSSREALGYVFNFSVREPAQETFAAFTGTHTGEYLCLTIDKEIVSCATLPEQPLSRAGALPMMITDDQAATYSALLATDLLPSPLQVETVETVSPALDPAAIARGRNGLVVGGAAVLIFLIVTYRLPGLLMDLSLLIYGSSMLTLFKLIPLPVTLLTLAGFVTATLLAVLTQLLLLQQIRDAVAAGRPPLAALTTTRPLARSTVYLTHVLSLILAILFWLLGVQSSTAALQWLGISLLAGSAISLFATLVAFTGLLHATFEATHDRPSEWTLGF